VGPRAGLDMVVKRKIPSPCQDSNPRSLVISRGSDHTVGLFACRFGSVTIKYIKLVVTLKYRKQDQ
jgi:hypothetical protein